MTAVDSIVQSVLSSRRLRRRTPTYQEFAPTVRIYAGPAHIKGTPYRLGSDPSQAFLLQQFDSGRWKRFYVCAPPQFGGKTLTAIVIPMLRQVIGARVPVGYGLPTLADLDKAWAEKLFPALRDSGYGTHLPASGPGARGGRGHTLQLSDPETGEAEGLIVFLAGGGYGSTVAAALIDEVDQFRTSSGEPLWGAIEDIFNRANAYGAAALRVAAGTIEDDERSVILPLVFEQGTGTVPHPRCPHCKAWVRLSFDHLSIDFADEDTAAASVRLACPSCATAWGEDDRQAALRDCRFPHQGQTVTEHGEVIGAEPRTQALGLWWSALESPHANLPDLAREWYRAKVALEVRGDHELMRKYWRYRRCQVYAGDKGENGDTIIPTRNRLAALSAASNYSLDVDRKEPDGDSIHLTHIPEWCEHTTVGVDVQRGGERAPGRLIFATISRGNGRGALTGWGSVVAAPKGRQPTEAELHAALDSLSELLLTWAPSAPIVARGVDVGDQQDEICRWLRSHRDWRPVKGTGPIKVGDPRDRPGWLYVRGQKSAPTLTLMETNSVTRIIHGEILAKDRDRPGSLLLPQGLVRNSALVQHLCATVEYAPGKWSTSKKDSKYHHEWQERHDYLDAAAIARMLAYDWEQRENSPKPPARKYGVVGSAFGGI